MMLNYIWVAFFVIGFIVALIKLIFLGDTSVFPALMDSTFASSKYDYVPRFEYIWFDDYSDKHHDLPRTAGRCTPY